MKRKAASSHGVWAAKRGLNRRLFAQNLIPSGFRVCAGVSARGAREPPVACLGSASAFNFFQELFLKSSATSLREASWGAEGLPLASF